MLSTADTAGNLGSRYLILVSETKASVSNMTRLNAIKAVTKSVLFSGLNHRYLNVQQALTNPIQVGRAR